MTAFDEEVNVFATVVFENVRQRYSLDHARVIPCLTIALGLAEGDLLYTNPEISADESRSAIFKMLDKARDLSIEVLQETEPSRRKVKS